MAKNETRELEKFLKAFDAEKVSLVLWLRDFVWKLYPSANEIIYDNYNALAIGWSVTEKLGHTFCNVSIMRANQNIHFGFYWGSRIADPQKILLGQGNQYRYILVQNKKDFPSGYMKELLKEAHIYSVGKVKNEKDFTSGHTIVKSISEKKRTAGKPKALPRKK